MLRPDSPELSAQRPRWGPTRDYPPLKGGVGHPKALSPLRHREAQAAVLNEVVPARVAILLFAGCPPDISRLISEVVLNALNAVRARGLHPNVPQKGIEAQPPFLADRDTASSIVLVSSVVGIGASLNDVQPRPILGAETAPWSVSVGRAASDVHLHL